MTSTEKYLKPHSVFGELSFDEYCTKIPEFYFRKEVPEDVINNFEVVEKLLALSYYEYKLIDEAYAKTIHTFEMAMSIRYKDFFPNARKIVFNTLIIELSKLNLFETNLDTLNHVKYMRNHFAHPERHSFAGIAYWNGIEYINRLINEMYEDVNLRLERVKESKELIERLHHSKLNSAAVIEIQGKPTILYRLQLLFINNKQTPPSYLFACTPLFDLQASKEGSIRVPFCFKAKLTDLAFLDNTLTGTSSSSKEKISFSPITQYENLLSSFEIWNLEFEKSKNKIQFELSMNHYIPGLLIPEIQEFQKI